ncbi:MAG: response regulator [Promethearchaeota archaeon]|jgi:CheY-like chemotaxis protein
MAQKIFKTKEMKKYELETGKQAIWNDEVTKGFVKWQKGERLYDVDKERVALYIPKDMKEKWVSFADNNNYSTLSKLIREALEFYIQHKPLQSNKKGPINFNLNPNLSHDLKERLTSIMAYLQLLIEDKKYSVDYDVIMILKKIFTQCLSFEQFITYNFENLNPEKEKTMNKNDAKYDILIIEDNYETMDFLSGYFKSLGYSCKEARSGRRGLEIIKESKPSIIFLDVLLPDLSGYDVVKSVRSSMDYKDVKIIFLTALPKSEVLKQIDELGANGLISKPFSLKDFEIIDKILK